MSDKYIEKPGTRLHGEVTVPGDKSISHRAVMFGAIAQGRTEITNFLQGEDCLATIDCFQKMGISIENTNHKVTVLGKGLRGLTPPSSSLNVGNSGTTTRLISGILAGQSFETTLTGDTSLNARPMSRIMEPLQRMGCSITSRSGNNCAPLNIQGGHLHGITFDSKVASAQVKSCLLLAGLYADSDTIVSEPALSRNHTELMLTGFGARLCSFTTIDKKAAVSISPCDTLYAQRLLIPGDISSAAYFIAAGLLVPNSELLIKNVGLNPTRAGILSVCRSMGGNITFINEKEEGGEPSADLLVRSSSLHGITIDGSIIPTLIDEIPIIAVLAAFANGRTIIKDAAELKVKETNRIAAITDNLTAMGGHITATADGMIIEGGAALHGASINSFFDHRIAMSFAIAGLMADGTTKIQDSHCVDVSYPAFFSSLKNLYQ